MPNTSHLSEHYHALRGASHTETPLSTDSAPSGTCRDCVSRSSVLLRLDHFEIGECLILTPLFNSVKVL